MEFGKKHVLIWGSIFLLLVGLVLSIHQLYVMFATLALLAPASYLMSRGTLSTISVRREASGIMKEGQEQPVRLYVRNDGVRRRYLFTVTDQLPDGLEVTGPGTTIIDALAADQEMVVTYTMRARRRGVYRLGPVQLGHWDLLGLFAFARQAGDVDELVVHPTPEKLPESWLRAIALNALRQPRRRFRGEGTEFYGTRRYLPGDDLRRVDWKSTARRGELIVRQYERAEATDCTVVLDLQRQVHSGADEDSTLERGVKLAASVAVQLLERGSRVGLLATGSKNWSQAASADPRQKLKILDALARVQADTDADLAEQIRLRRGLMPKGGMVVIISPRRTAAALELGAALVDEGYAVTWMIPAAPWRSLTAQEMSEDQLAARLQVRGVRAWVVDPGRPLALGMRGGRRVA